MTKEQLASALYDALKASDRDSYMDGILPDRRTVVDGDFDLFEVAESLLQSLKREPPHCPTCDCGVPAEPEKQK